MSTYSTPLRPDELMHYGVKGMKWGVRRYQNTDGTYTEMGRRHYGAGSKRKNRAEARVERAYAELDNRKKELDIAKKKGKSKIEINQREANVADAQRTAQILAKRRDKIVSQKTLKEKWDTMDSKKKTAIKVGAGIAVGTLAVIGGVAAYKAIKDSGIKPTIPDGVHTADIHRTNIHTADVHRVKPNVIKTESYMDTDHIVPKNKKAREYKATLDALKMNREADINALKSGKKIDDYGFPISNENIELWDEQIEEITQKLLKANSKKLGL